MYVSLDKENRICATSFEKKYLVDYFEFDFPQDFDFTNQNNYKIVDNQLVFVPLEPSPIEKIGILENKLQETDYVVIKKLESMVSNNTLTNEESERYDSIFQKRKQWRQQINTLQQQITTAQSQ